MNPALPRIGLIGFGTIGRCVHDTLLAQGCGDALAGILVRNGHAGKVVGNSVPVFERLKDLIGRGSAVIAETASQSAVAEYGPAVLKAGCNLLITSTGALADDALRQDIEESAKTSGRRVFLPSGAIGGIDAISAMRLAGLDALTYRSRKPPAAWRGSKAESLIDLDSLCGAATFFEGSAREAAKAFPKNANVAVTVALAGLGLDGTRVELIADSAVTANIHEVRAEGASGRVVFVLEGAPFPDNPRSSMLTAYSVVRSLLNIRSAIPL